MIQFDLPDNVLEATPQIHDSAFVAKGAQIMGDVRLHENSSVWYNCVLRGDINYIEVGRNSNIQDGCILHLENELPCIVGKNVTVGHHVNLHGCVVEDACLIGIGAIVLSGARIGKGSIIGAGTVILENTVIPPFSLVVGVPGKVVRQNDDSVLDSQTQWAQKYVELAKVHKQKMKPTS